MKPQWRRKEMEYLIIGFLLVRCTHAIPVIIDTDVGYSTDDIAAVALALQRPELEVKFIATATGDTAVRTKILAKFLHVVGREDIPIGNGVRTNKTELSLAEWADDFDLKDFKGKIYEDGVKAMASMIMQSHEKITILEIAPPTNIYSMLKRFPNVTTKATIVAMSGSIYKGYHNSSEPVAEYNARYCPKCTQALYSAAWNVTISPLDTCGVFSLKGQNYGSLLKSTGITTLEFIQISLFWSFKTSYDISRETEILYDAVAPLMSIETGEFAFDYKNLPIRVTPDGKTIIDKENGTIVQVALYWKNNGLQMYEQWFVETMRL